MILLHGVGASAQDFVPLAHALRESFPAAAFVLPDGVEPFDASPALAGRQWFSIQGVTEEDRPARVRAALPAFVELIRACQRHWHRRGRHRADRLLAGLDHGAGGLRGGLAWPDACWPSRRYARLPETVSPLTSYHFLHGAEDAVIAASNSRAAFEHSSSSEGRRRHARHRRRRRPRGARGAGRPGAVPADAPCAGPIWKEAMGAGAPSPSRDN